MPNLLFVMKNKMRNTFRMIFCIGFFISPIIIGLPWGVPFAFAETSHPEGWYRHRTNSVPYQPQNITVDAAGGIWVSAMDGSEYAPGVWYRPSGAAADSFQYMTNDRRNNLSVAGFNPPIEKPQLAAAVLCVVRDKAGNTWYGLKNRKVLCEKADKSWLTFDMPNSSSIDPGVNTTGVDSAYRIRLIDHLDGTQDRLLISYRGILHVNAAFTVIASRQVTTSYNNDFIRDALIDTQGRYWITSERGLEKGTSLVNTSYVKDIYASDPAAPKEGTVITRIVEDSLRNIWFGSDSYGADGVYCFTSAGAWNKYTDGIVSAVGKRVHDIAADADGSVWFGAVYSADGGILRFVPSSAGGQWYRYRGADLGLDSEEIPGLCVGGGGLWFVTGYTPSMVGNGTGVHFLTLNQGSPHVTHYTYRERSTTLTSLRFNYIAADLTGGVWFPAYDDPSIARLKPDGSWQQFRKTENEFLGNFGIYGVAVDSKNKVYFAPVNSPPVAYNATAEQWIDLPSIPFTDFYYYGVYIDPQDGKWFFGAFGVYYLDSGNTGWTRFSTVEIPQFPDDYVEGVLMDDTGNVWFMCRTGIAIRKKSTGATPVWMKFTANDRHGYIGGYRVYQDDTGHIWNAAKQKYDAQTDMWQTVSDTGPFDHRHLRFRNGRVPADMDMSGALAPITTLEERLMTVDSHGTIYFAGGIGLVGVSAGIVAYNPLRNQFLGVWSDGVWMWERATNKWSKIPSTADASMIASGRVDNDSLDDLIGVWSSGLYVKLSSTGQWLKLSSVIPDWIAAGDLNNDGRDDVIGSWPGDGTYYRDSVSGKWVRLSSPARQLASGNIGGTRDDLAGVWSDGLWVRYSADGSWKKIDSGIPVWIAAGDMSGDNRADIVGSYGSGTWYRNSASGGWFKLTTPAAQLAAGDLDGDGRDDLVGIWSNSVYVRYGATGQWQQISSSTPKWIVTGKMTGAIQAAGLLADPSESGEEVLYLSDEGPGGWHHPAVSSEADGPMIQE